MRFRERRRPAPRPASAPPPDPALPSPHPAAAAGPWRRASEVPGHGTQLPRSGDTEPNSRSPRGTGPRSRRLQASTSGPPMLGLGVVVYVPETGYPRNRLPLRSEPDCYHRRVARMRAGAPHRLAFAVGCSLRAGNGGAGQRPHRKFQKAQLRGVNRPAGAASSASVKASAG